MNVSFCFGLHRFEKIIFSREFSIKPEKPYIYIALVYLYVHYIFFHVIFLYIIFLVLNVIYILLVHKITFASIISFHFIYRPHFSRLLFSTRDIKIFRNPVYLREILRNIFLLVECDNARARSAKIKSPDQTKR